MLEKFTSEIAGFYDVATYGQAPHQRFGAHWRPLPIVAKQQREDWVVMVPKGKWRVIAKHGAEWRVAQVLSVAKPTEKRLRIFGAKSVELLVDRRP